MGEGATRKVEGYLVASVWAEHFVAFLFILKSFAGPSILNEDLQYVWNF